MNRPLCRFCLQKAAYPCRNTRDMADAHSRTCFAALIARGGGERAEHQDIAARIALAAKKDRPDDR